MVNVTLHYGDCIDFIYTLKPKSVNLIIIDPPYFKIKGSFDFIWKTFDDYLAFMDKVAQACKYALADNGSLYVFAHAKRVAYIQVILDKYFNLENNLVWEVYDRQTNKGIDQFRCYAPITERILFYSCEVEENFVVDYLQKYLLSEYEKCGKPISFYKKLCGFTGNQPYNWFTPKNKGNAQWAFPTKEHYLKLQTTGFFQKEYEILRQEYKSLRRPFNNVHKLTDVIRHSQESHITRHYDHDTVKPLGLISKLIETSSNEGDIVLDGFMGSGTTGEAAVKLNRHFIGCELDKDYFAIAKKRIAHAEHDLINIFGE